ncbi:MAG TPA: metalloregulator ArsR/SmtB family transcription factor [Candidatus Cybelea sp.]|nr:metalloregulator ArsR/SmtB family transcription factor [Candidatus Cybelea sp.]
MAGQTDIAIVAALLGDPSRASICVALMGGEALPASELAYIANVTPQTMSGHLSQLVAGNLLSVEQHGRHRYYRLAGEPVARAIEALSLIAPPPKLRARRVATPEPMRQARRCYDHLAGEIGVAVAEALLRRRLLRRHDGEFAVTAKGSDWFRGCGIDVTALREGPRPLTRACLDWSERRPHLAGALGAGLLGMLFERGLLKQAKSSRIVAFTPSGRAWLKRELDISA